MALDEDLGHVGAVFLGEQHVQIYRQEPVDELLSALGEIVLAQFKQHVGFQRDGAVGRVHLGGDAGGPQRVAQRRDDARAHAHQLLDLGLLFVQHLLLFVDLGLLGAQLYAQRVQLFLLGGDLLFLFLHQRLCLAQLGLLGREDALGVGQVLFRGVQPDLLGQQLRFVFRQLRLLCRQIGVGLVQVVLLAGDFRHVDFIHIEVLIHDVEHDQYEYQQQGAHQVGKAHPLYAVAAVAAPRLRADCAHASHPFPAGKSNSTGCGGGASPPAKG